MEYRSNIPNFVLDKLYYGQIWPIYCRKDTVLTSFTVDKQTVNESVLINLGSNKYKIQYSYSNKLQTTAIDLGNYFNNEGKLDVDNNQLMKRISKSVSNILQHRSGYVSSRSHSTIADPDSARASSTYRPVQATRVQRH
ncbi:unnamed protein product [Rotaria socialis]